MLPFPERFLVSRVTPLRIKLLFSLRSTQRNRRFPFKSIFSASITRVDSILFPEEIPKFFTPELFKMSSHPFHVPQLEIPLPENTTVFSSQFPPLEILSQKTLILDFITLPEEEFTIFPLPEEIPPTSIFTPSINPVLPFVTVPHTVR